VTGFYARQHDAIDYVRPSPAEKWHATNLSGLRFAGVESSVSWVPAQSQRVAIAWTSLNGAQRALNGLQSEYVFNYPVNNVHATWDAVIHHDWLVRNAVQIAQRYQKSAYPVWNLACSRKSGRLRPYLRLDNLSNTGYQEISGVAMPGRSITGGLAILLGHE
jgi:iron complex outermembrane receptor protein